MIHDPVRGPLLERMIEIIRKSKAKIRFIGLSAYLENEAGFLSWFPASHLLSYQRPVELRKGIMRGGVFRYITHNQGEYGEEEFFKVKEGQNTPYEDCLRDTVSCFIEKDEPTLLFFPTKKETRKWAAWLVEEIDAPRAEEAIAELSRLEETRSRDELLYLLEKGIAYHNADLSWEERNLVENYLRAGEIKIICATTTLAMGINLPFKNVILSGDKYVSDNGDYKSSYRTSLSLADVENMGGRAGRLNWKRGEFGRVIFLANSLFAETVLQNIYFKFMKEDKIKKDNLGRIKVLSERLAWGVEEEGLKLARLHIPGLGRSYIRALLREGYDNRKCLEELGEEELAKVVPKRLAGRIKRRFSGVLSSPLAKTRKPKTNNLPPETRNPKPATLQLTTVLEIDQHRPDRIIFEGKEIKVTATEFSLAHLLAQHNGQVMSYEDIIKKLWGAETDAIYSRVNYHFSKIRSTILKTIGKSKRNKEKVKNIFKVVSRRGIMLNLEEDKLKIN